MDCTVCRVKLKVRVHEGALVHGCEACRGFFVAHDTLAKIAREEVAPRGESERRAAADASSGRQRVADASPVSARRCPVCERMMGRFSYAFSSAVIVDGCDQHGIWLDDGELERIEAWAEADRRGMIASASPRILRPEAP